MRFRVKPRGHFKTRIQTELMEAGGGMRYQLVVWSLGAVIVWATMAIQWLCGTGPTPLDLIGGIVVVGVVSVHNSLMELRNEH